MSILDGSTCVFVSGSTTGVAPFLPDSIVNCMCGPLLFSVSDSALDDPPDDGLAAGVDSSTTLSGSNSL